MEALGSDFILRAEPSQIELKWLQRGPWPLPCEITEKGWQSATCKRSLPEPGRAGAIILDFPASRTVKNIFVLFVDYPVDGTFFYSPNGLRQWGSSSSRSSKSLQWNSDFGGSNISLFTCLVLGLEDSKQLWLEFLGLLEHLSVHVIILCALSTFWPQGGWTSYRAAKGS